MSRPAGIAAALAALLGETHCTAEVPARARYRVRGALPDAVAIPGTPEEVAAVLAHCRERGWAVLPWGGASGTGGPPPPRYDVALSLSRLEGVIEHDAENLTLTAGAGTTMFDADRELRPSNQMLAIGWPWERHTLGGLVAANRGAPMRMAYGALRDQLLGVRLALPDGSLLRYGGKVLKNVAGYDLTKMVIGSHGAVGVIVETTWKLFARPDHEAYVPVALPTAREAAALALKLANSPLLPSCLFLAGPVAAAELARRYHLGDLQHQWLLLAGFAGRAAALRRQFKDSGVLVREAGGTYFPPLETLLEAAMPRLLGEPTADPPGTRVALRVGMPPGRLGEGLEAVQAALGEAEGPLVADVAAGRIHVALPGNAIAPDALRNAVATLRTTVAPWRGYVTVERVPEDWPDDPLGWDDPGGEGRLMALIKSRLDPEGILAPGRLPGAPAPPPSN